jgi:hypothetical protein
MRGSPDKVTLSAAKGLVLHGEMPHCVRYGIPTAPATALQGPRRFCIPGESVLYRAHKFVIPGRVATLSGRERSAMSNSNEREVYISPRAMRMSDGAAAAGDCSLPGSSDAGPCNPSGSTAGETCGTGSNASWPCRDGSGAGGGCFPGNSPGGECYGPGNSARVDCSIGNSVT